MSQVQVSPALMALAASRTAVVSATTASEEAQASHTKLLTRRSELQATSAEALRAARDYGDADGKRALAIKIADLDLADLEVTIHASADKLRDLNVALATARANCAQCEQDAKLEENSIALQAMLKIVAANEEGYLASVAELHRLFVLVNGKSMGNGTVWKCHQPTAEHRALVVSNAVPALRG
ncbi:hypothetical protein R75465_07970 [Paraburkholderia aspalathi]|uniref:hypothetical protein n=1 Tax=Paraburkholderia aspalathi TaxID=1324617 RepID=UPI001B2ECCFA|nr:hypothetical protein [Paraburkholderia aspalathi]CAE6866148.1 hypothetical protein R75465_07970 [Paraburkholderia aspalathi]